MSNVAGDEGACGGMKGDFQEHDVVLVRRRTVRPGESDNVFLKLEDGQECVPPGSVDTELGKGQNVAVLRLDPIVCRQS